MLIRVFTSHSLALIMRLYIHAVLLIGYLTVHQYYSECMSFMYSQVITYDIVLLNTKIGVWTLVDYSNASSDMLIQVFTSHRLTLIMKLDTHVVLLIDYQTVQ